jgi:ribonuclease P protein component
MLGRLVHKADFERLLATRSRVRSAHFALHHVASRPAAPHKPGSRAVDPELSTVPKDNLGASVDDLPDTVWMGCMVPKRHARRAVTRNLIKRQMRAAIERRDGALPHGLWLVRLHAGFASAQFPSAASPALALAVRGELDALLARVAGAAAAAAAPVPV